MKKRKVIPELPADASDEETIDWLTRYDLEDRIRAGVTEIVEDETEEELLLLREIGAREYNKYTVKLATRLPVKTAEALRELAKRHGTDAATLARIWLKQRIFQEGVAAYLEDHKPKKRGRATPVRNKQAGRHARLRKAQ